MKRFLMVCALLAIAACAQQPPPAPVAAAPPPPPPPPPPPTTYTVYFDYNSSLLGPEGREILRLAANAYRAGNPASVQVTGYADPSGATGYNKRLSLKRASVAAAVLVEDGVPRDSLVISGDGETSTGQNPGQDRRVDIVLGGSPGASPPSS
jgi:outer membrane protein OmpA-like peptidoglycan-associated protein